MPDPPAAAAPFTDWSPIVLAPSAEVASDRCLHFPHPHYPAAPSGFVVVRGSQSGQTRLATASLRPGPVDRDAVFVSAELARRLQPRAESSDDDTFHAVVRTARLRDLFVYGGSRFLPLWAAVSVALAGLAAAGARFATAGIDIAVAAAIMAVGVLAIVLTAAKDIRTALRNDC